jgi:outer membrane receptor for ferric coprogen and ferric-rhodotorulic acid
VPRNTFRLATTYDVAQVEGLMLGASVRWQSGIHRDAIAYDLLFNPTPTRIEQDAYAIVGLMARYEFSDRWSATLNFDNITDEKYIPSLYWEQGYYAAPRNVGLTVAYRFQ